MAPEIVFPSFGALLFALGWPLARRRVRPNHWYGLRVPATLADERVWYDANAIAGREMMGLGLATIVLALVLPLSGMSGRVYAGTCAAVLGLGIVVVPVCGWLVANRLLRERRQQ